MPTLCFLHFYINWQDLGKKSSEKTENVPLIARRQLTDWLFVMTWSFLSNQNVQNLKLDPFRPIRTSLRSKASLKMIETKVTFAQMRIKILSKFFDLQTLQNFSCFSSRGWTPNTRFETFSRKVTFLKMGHLRLLYLYFRLFNTVDSKCSI